jgi:hypothetical protein
MLTVKVGEKTYELDMDESLRSLTGLESATVEEFIGGWHMFDAEGHSTRSLIVILWLAMRSGGEATSLDEVANMPGLMFGDLVEIDDDGEGRPQDPMEDPGRPLDESNASNGSSGGTLGSEAIPETSDSSGIPLSPASTA